MKTLTLFAGAGGADCGMRDAGAEHVRCIEYDESAAATLKAAGFPAVHGDVRDPTLYRGLPPIGLLWASPPCQDWSSAGKREGASGSRNGWPWTWLAVDHLRRRGLGPEWFIAENVPGMLTHSGEHCGSGCCADPDRCPRTYFLGVIMREVRERFAWAEWRVLDAASFGVPQFRKRVFIVAGPRAIRWPTPTHGEPTTQTGLFGPGLLPWVTVRAALGLDCGLRKDRGAGMEARWGVRHFPADGPAPSVRCEGSGGVTTIGPGLKGSEWTVDRPSPVVRDGNGTAGVYIRTEATGAVATPDTEPAPTVPTVGNQYLHAEDPGVRVSKAASEPGRLDRPSPTVSAVGECKGSGEGGNPQKLQRASDALFLATGRRRLTVAECSVLQNFPPAYPWQGTKTSQYRQVGNAVPRRVAEVLTRAVMAAR